MQRLQVFFRFGDIIGNAPNQCGDIRKFFLITQFVQKIDVQMAAVYALVKIEQMDFQNRFAIVMHRRTGTQAGNAVNFA